MIAEEAVGFLESDANREAGAAYKKEEKQGAGQKRKNGSPNLARIKYDGAGRH